MQAAQETTAAASDDDEEDEGGGAAVGAQECGTKDEEMKKVTLVDAVDLEILQDKTAIKTCTVSSEYY